MWVYSTFGGDFLPIQATRRFVRLAVPVTGKASRGYTKPYTWVRGVDADVDGICYRGIPELYQWHMSDSRSANYEIHHLRRCCG
jgi:hypothetical protein